MKVVVFETEAWEREVFSRLEAQHEVVYSPDPLTAANAGEFADAEAITTFIYSRPDKAALASMPRLRLISTRSTGYDHIDTDHCREAGIAVSNVPSYGENTVAEHVFGLLLTISHNLWNAIDRTRKGDFSLKGLRGFDLRGRTMGVVGTGAIGRHVVEIARGFGMPVLAYDAEPEAEFASAAGFRYVALDELLAGSDVVSLHVPLNENTKHMIDGAAFGKMRRGSVLINTARGAVIDVKALVRALADGTVAAAGLDVLPDEPVIRGEAELLRTVFREEHDLETLLADHVLLRLRNVYITPHSAFDTVEAVGRILETTVDNIEAMAAGSPANVVGGSVPAGA